MAVLCFGCTNSTGEGKGTNHKGESTAQYDLTMSELNPVYEAADRLEFLRSYLVWKDGEMAATGYFQPYHGDSLDHLRSGTKSIMSILIGVAVDQGIINSVEDPIDKYIGSILEPYDTEKKNITIKDLLTMTGGFQWTENGGVGFNEWVTSSDPIRYVLNRNIVNEPGSTFNYNSAGVHLLSVILTEASGMSSLDFAKQYLFDPLGISKYRWNRLGKGYYNGGAGLELQPKDLLKIGIMMQQKGEYDGKRILSESWVDESTKAYIHAPDGLDGYGYLWWIARQEHHMMYTASGFGGQFLVVHPKLKSVMVITSQWRNTNGRMDRYLDDLKKVMIMNLEAFDNSEQN